MMAPSFPALCSMTALVMCSTMASPSSSLGEREYYSDNFFSWNWLLTPRPFTPPPLIRHHLQHQHDDNCFFVFQEWAGARCKLLIVAFVVIIPLINIILISYYLEGGVNLSILMCCSYSMDDAGGANGASLGGRDWFIWCGGLSYYLSEVWLSRKQYGRPRIGFANTEVWSLGGAHMVGSDGRNDLQKSSHG